MGPSEPNARSPSREVGRYVLYGEIAAGGMATVHFGRLSGPVGFSRTVAIKRLHPQFAKDPEFVTMFLDEARLAGRIRHPNVVPTLDVVATEGEIFLVMEYVQGESLSRLARSMKMQNQRIPPRILATVMSGVLHGLHSAHEAKDEQGHPLSIVHRDVSPQNILVGTDGTTRVLDFGVAKAAGRLQSTREGQIKGKISYMAPEQLSGGHVTRATDIYAAAVVLWECLVGHRLFEGDNEAMIVVRALEGRVQPPSVFVHGLPAEVDAVIMKGLARDPAQRFGTAREMALALERAFGVVPASEIGEWVEAIAGAELDKRAQTIAEIESSSVSNVSQISPSAMMKQLSELSSPRIASIPPAEARHPSHPSQPGLSSLNEGASQVSTISVSHSGRADREASERRLRLPLVILLAAMVALAAAVGVVLAMNHSPSGSKTTAAGPAQTAPPAASSISALASADPAIAGMGAQTGPAAAPGTGATADTAAPPASATPTPIAPPTSVAAAHTPPPADPRSVSPHTRHGGGTAEGARHPPVEPKKPAAANCDPPYTVDDQGHKMYKMECLSP
jgi:serine/threonine protein kinase